MSDNVDKASPSAFHVWTVREAKARLSEILRRASQEGPQQIGVQDEYVVMSRADFDRLAKDKRPPFGKFLLDALRDIGEFPIPERDRTPPRENPFADG